MPKAYWISTYRSIHDTEALAAYAKLAGPALQKPTARGGHMIYKGSCHCGKIALEVEGELTGAMECNCSICSRKGSLLWFVPRDKLHLLTSEESVGTYTFNKHIIKHHFCQTCGIHPYAEAVDSKGNPMGAINIRCLADVDLTSVPVKHFDGRSM